VAVTSPFAAIAQPLAIRPGDPLNARGPMADGKRTRASHLPPPNPWALSWMQCEVMKLLVAGLEHKEIGREMNISDKTVSSHVERLKQKMEAGSTLQAALMWDRHFRSSEAAAHQPHNQE
jgi:DNA-binding NarL/FixJ family response regulator